MEPNVIYGAIVAAGISLGLGATVWERHIFQRVLAHTMLAQWEKQGRKIRLGPLRAENYGAEPHSSHYLHVWQRGVIGVVDQQLVFSGSRRGPEASIDFANIHWVGTRVITVRQSKYNLRKSALVIHHEYRGRWYVSVCTVHARLDTLLRVIGQGTGLNPCYLGEDREDFGPHMAQRMVQDVYGQWQVTTTSGLAWGEHQLAPALERVGLTGQLYLAPNCLVYNHYPALYLAQIRRVDLYEKGLLQKLNPFNEELLRIEYEQDDKHHVAGFLVRNGRQWAAALQARLNIPVEVHEGRKKK